MTRFTGEAVPGLAEADSLFAVLRAACKPDWDAYVRHPFVLALGDGSLAHESFRHYLQQDYLFLIHFARGYALAAYKADTLDGVKAAAAGMSVILDEMNLHVAYCERWGVSRTDLDVLPEARATLAYTRYVLERGMSGDLLDLHVALSPCVIGYAEIGLMLVDQVRPDHPYKEWIETYAGDEFVAAARQAVATLDTLMRERGGEGRMESLIQTFRDATRLEADFWQMGLDRSL